MFLATLSLKEKFALLWDCSHNIMWECHGDKGYIP